MKRLIRLDASSFELWPCRRKFQQFNRNGLIPKLGQAPLDFGATLHWAIATWYKRNKTDEQLIIDQAVIKYAEKLCVKDHPRSIENLAQTLTDYFEEYRTEGFTPLTVNDKTAVELSFSIPIYSNEHTDVNLTGAIDALGTWHEEGRIVIKDIKHSTTTSPTSHIEEQLSRPQFHIYTWAAKHEGLITQIGSYVPVVVDCVYINKKYTGAKFLRSSPTIMESCVVDRTMEAVLECAKELAELKDEVEWTYNYNQCHGKYFRCDLYNICQLPSDSQQTVIDMLFNKRDYNPATFGD